ncbi:hypothetical protein D3C79_191330 [compost metagenome]
MENQELKVGLYIYERNHYVCLQSAMRSDGAVQYALGSHKMSIADEAAVDSVIKVMDSQYDELAEMGDSESSVVWFDGEKEHTLGELIRLQSAFKTEG